MKYLLIICGIILLGQATPLRAVEYALPCLEEDTNYYICGTKKIDGGGERGILYQPVQQAVYTTLFYSYPDVNIAHRGVDIIGKREILPAFTGRVVELCKTFCGAYGRYVILYHEAFNLFTLYAHMEQVYVNNGEEVIRNEDTNGTVLGIMGNTGASEGVHLHFEVRSQQSHNYEYRLDPVRFLKIHIRDCSNMFGLVDALYSSVHRYQQWYGIDADGYVYSK